MSTKRIKHPFGFEAKRPVANPFNQANDTFDIDLDIPDHQTDLVASPLIIQQ